MDVDHETFFWRNAISSRARGPDMRCPLTDSLAIMRWKLEMVLELWYW